MATRRAKRKLPQMVKPKEAVTVAAALGFIAVIANHVSLFVIIAMLAICCAGGAWLLRWNRVWATQRAVLARVSASIELHEHALISYYHQSRREDLFGNVDDSRWSERVDTFLRKQIAPDIADFAAWRRSPCGQKAAAMVHETTAQRVAADRGSDPLACVDASSLTPLEYERHCADLLKAKGWNVKMTPTTRDGGADLIAEKHDWRMIVQCKRYAQPVGNKAVQEVTSAVRLYNGNIACVVAPTGFTRQAQQEATGLSVHLLHHSALPTFAERLAA